ncbi:MAG: phenylacetate--CoA ligase family protein [Acidobacteria bacterium]|uniref:Phenylacetate--CoA ligase family protein n=1 Tax=Candidatus Polarisedimenticola svalbardensis TaxID=2886004 RepID=A0A8J7CLC3_9BACT|nr:phenylacetate--CoA ligase family protein [Candidatus Polarisedimenticola svalbardensis]
MILKLYGRLPIFAQNWACSWAGYRRSRLRYTPYFWRTLSAWEISGNGSLASLHALQHGRLRTLVERARKYVPHYRDLDLPPPAGGSDPREAIRETLSSIPVLEKAHYRETPDRFLAEDIPRSKLIRGRTSGTTGTALPLWFTAEALAEEYATIWRMRRREGVGFRDWYQAFGGQIIVPFSQEAPPFYRSNRHGRQFLHSLYHMTPGNMGSYVDAVHDLPSSYIIGYPSSLHLVGRAMLEGGRSLPKGHLKGIFTSSESLLAFHRNTIEEAFGAKIYDRYGTSEFAVSMTMCRERKLHVDMEFGIVEVDVVESGDGWERGPLLVTGFGNDATPFIRYRIGDLGTRLTSPCSCGREGDVFADVDGRIEDFIVTPDGRRIGRLDHIFKDLLDIAEAQILQETEAAIEVLIVPRESYDRAGEERLLRELRSRLGEIIKIDIRKVESIPREPNGKFRAVRSRVGKQS